ncbi:GNAT family N-acetyltransferase [Legionella erythra]|uniref:GNAT family acetyltransferase n=1 Tax=Legionella erythra TaxID=448 RepID=A0A0W0TFT4_LEGER|nr:GNAT family N-acetyltransferase [Legionella erythra]KTC94085.1 GNAT family acetyltransferase [Legionella erythra]
MIETIHIDYQENPSPQDIQILGDGIIAYAKLKKNQPTIRSFAFFLRDKTNTIQGGCHGSMYYGCLYIDLLWIDEPFRGTQWGTRLMRSAEELGKANGCLFSTVNTMDWEALGFYQKLGYDIEYQRSGYLHDSTLYFLKKEFAAKVDHHRKNHGG